MAENAIMLLLPVVTNCRRCRRYGRIVLLVYTFLVVYLYRLLESPCGGPSLAEKASAAHILSKHKNTA